MLFSWEVSGALSNSFEEETVRGGDHQDHGIGNHMPLPPSYEEALSGKYDEGLPSYDEAVSSQVPQV